jgi:hypothetical protein
MQRFLPTLGWALALGTLVACSGGDADEMDTMAADTTAMAAPAATDTMAGMAPAGDASMLAADVDTVVTAAERGLTNLAPAVAVPLIERIERSLAGTGDASLGAVATDLGRLRTALGGGEGNIGEILTELGNKVTAYAPTAPEAVRARLTTLGTALTTQGGSLGR